MKSFFIDHPHSVNETYLQHFFFSFATGIQMIMAGFACIIHAVFPFLCDSYGSSTIYGLEKKFTMRQQKIKIKA